MRENERGGKREFTTGQDRSNRKAVAHEYEGPFSDLGNPMCVRGWNRDDGEGYSIWRGNAPYGVCKVCTRRIAEDRPSVPSRKRKTHDF